MIFFFFFFFFEVFVTPRRRKVEGRPSELDQSESSPPSFIHTPSPKGISSENLLFSGPRASKNRKEKENSIFDLRRNKITQRESGQIPTCNRQKKDERGLQALSKDGLFFARRTAGSFFVLSLTWNLMHLPSAEVADREGDGNLRQYDK